jgi:hypothetical protein
MDIYTRVENLEKLVDELVKMINRSKMYTDSDISGVRQSVSEITPYTETKTAFYGEKEKTFYNVPQGDVSVTFDNYSGDYSVKRISDRVTVFFDTLTGATNITISVI